MILSFKRNQFVAQIKYGIKIHTFRKGFRWKPGMKIHFWHRNPRIKNVKKGIIPYQFALSECTDVIPTTINTKDNYIVLKFPNYEINLSDHELDVYAKNDGFDGYEDLKYFFGSTVLNGQTIFWSKVYIKSAISLVDLPGVSKIYIDIKFKSACFSRDFFLSLYLFMSSVDIKTKFVEGKSVKEGSSENEFILVKLYYDPYNKDWTNYEKAYLGHAINYFIEQFKIGNNMIDLINRVEK